MLLPIVPEMFLVADFNCKTTFHIRREFRTTPKFKDKYPWHKELSGNIKIIPSSHEKNTEAKRYERTIYNLLMEGIMNEKRGRFFDLSKEDMELLAWALASESRIISGDEAIDDFGNQEFDGIFQGMISPLEAINEWLESGLIVWNDTSQAYLEEWNKNQEKPQPETEKVRFEQITGYTYVGC